MKSSNNDYTIHREIPSGRWKSQRLVRPVRFCADGAGIDRHGAVAQALTVSPSCCPAVV
jgi:hypothetical protein